MLLLIVASGRGLDQMRTSSNIPLKYVCFLVPSQAPSVNSAGSFNVGHAIGPFCV